MVALLADAQFFDEPTLGHRFTSFPRITDVLCSIRVCGETYKLILINVHMPYESDTGAVEEFSSVLADVVALADQFNDYYFVTGGDFNVDFDKHKIHSRLLLDVCNDNDFRCMLHRFHIVLVLLITLLSRTLFLNHPCLLARLNMTATTFRTMVRLRNRSLSTGP
jgi:hypothetical protein